MKDEELLRPFPCSSVDIFPLLYALALGNESWRTGTTYGYLAGRESILDFLFGALPMQRRTLKSYPGQPACPPAMVGLPYILHTTDEISSSSSNPAIPTHVVGMRVFDPSVALITTIVPTYPDFNSQVFKPYGGGKIGIYSQWAAQSTQPSPSGPVEYEFYDYATNFAEKLNDYASSAPLGAQYVAAFQAISQAELYYQGGPGFPASARTQAQTDYFNGQSCSGPPPQQQIIDMQS